MLRQRHSNNQLINPGGVLFHSLADFFPDFRNDSTYQGISHKECPFSIILPFGMSIREHIQTFQFQGNQPPKSSIHGIPDNMLETRCRPPPSLVIMVLEGLSRESGKDIPPSL